MMELSTKGRYGTRLMVRLAMNYGNGPMLLTDIAREENVSRGYLEHITPLLKARGLILSNRGAHGGYQLAKNPSEITLLEILFALEGSLSPVKCVDAPFFCDKSETCVMRLIWMKLGDSIKENLEKISLEDLVRMNKSRN